MNIISQTAINLWRNVRTKTSPNGWESRNSPCCIHRGTTQDKRGRGGLKIDGENIVFNCFNCGFKASYQVGRPLYPKFIKMLTWLGADERTISKLKLESFRLTTTVEENIIQPRELKEIDNFPPSELLTYKHSKHAAYIEKRGLSINDYPFLISTYEDKVSKADYRNRIIIPFIFQDTMIGYSARSILSWDKARFIMRQTVPFVFGMDFVKYEHEWVILQEGIFDALSVKGLAVCHNEVSEEQENLINDLQKRIIVVPDLDKSGLILKQNSLIQTALDNDWNVAFPQWECKDLNEAYIKYGELAVIKHILDEAIPAANQTTIKVKQKMMFNKSK